MKEEIIYIHHMLTPRDILSVSNELERIGMQVKKVELGAAAFMNPNELSTNELSKALHNIGYRLLQKGEKEFIEQVKSLISAYLEKLHTKPEPPLLSRYLERHIGLAYSTISKRFSRIEGRSIESFYIDLKVSRIKQLIQNTDLSIKEIALSLNYSSPRSLARIFKDSTGFSVYSYKNTGRMGYLKPPL